MKKLLAGILAALLGFAAWSFQASKQITLAWDAMPTGETWNAVKIYDIGVTPEVLVATANCTTGPPRVCPTSVTFLLTRAPHTFVARSVNADWESGDSNSVGTPAPPTVPANLIKK
jgi:hypothetical protein